MRILFITLSNIGDVVLTLPVLSALRDNFSSSQIDVVVGPRPKEIFTKDPKIRDIFIYDKHATLREKMDFIKALKTRRYDLAVDLRTSLIPFLVGAKKRTGLISIGIRRVKHKKDVHLGKLESLGVGYRDQKNIYIDNKDRETIKRLLEEQGMGENDILVGVNPSSLSPLKRWRIDGFIEVINSLITGSKYKAILIGDATQTDISKEIQGSVRQEGLIDLTGKISLNELCALIERLGLLLTCDSASLHIACDLGVKVVAIFGPTDPEEYGPTGKSDIVVRKRLKCSPCKKAVCRFDHECMRDIGAKEVLEAVKKLV